MLPDLISPPVNRHLLVAFDQVHDRLYEKDLFKPRNYACPVTSVANIYSTLQNFKYRFLYSAVMKKSIVMVLLVLSLLMACSQSEVSSRRVVPTGAVAYDPVVSEPSRPVVQPVEEKTAAEALQEVKATETLSQPVAKQGATLYPPVVSSATGKDALLERTHAAFSKSSYVSSVDADKDFGAKYHEADGDPTNLPEEYGEGRQD